MDDDRNADAWPDGMTGRGLRGREIARSMITIAVILPMLLGLLLMSAPQGMGGGTAFENPNPLPAIVVGVGIVGYLIGLAVMIRIYRADPEAHASFWRSRRR